MASIITHKLEMLRHAIRKADTQALILILDDEIADHKALLAYHKEAGQPHIIPEMLIMI